MFISLFEVNVIKILSAFDCDYTASNSGSKLGSIEIDDT